MIVDDAHDFLQQSAELRCGLFGDVAMMIVRHLFLRSVADEPKRDDPNVGVESRDTCFRLDAHAHAVAAVVRHVGLVDEATLEMGTAPEDVSANDREQIGGRGFPDEREEFTSDDVLGIDEFAPKERHLLAQARDPAVDEDDVVCVDVVPQRSDSGREDEILDAEPQHQFDLCAHRELDDRIERCLVHVHAPTQDEYHVAVDGADLDPARMPSNFFERAEEGAERTVQGAGCLRLERERVRPSGPEYERGVERVLESELVDDLFSRSLQQSAVLSSIHMTSLDRVR